MAEKNFKNTSLMQLVKETQHSPVPSFFRTLPVAIYQKKEPLGMFVITTSFPRTLPPALC